MKQQSFDDEVHVQLPQKVVGVRRRLWRSVTVLTTSPSSAMI